MSPARGFSSRPGFLFGQGHFDRRSATCPRPRRRFTARKPGWFSPARFARHSVKHPRHCFLRKAMSTTAPPRPKHASRAKIRAINTRALPIQPWTCSSGAWRRSRVPKRRGPPRPAWPRSRFRWSASSRPAITWLHQRPCSAPAGMSSRTICRVSAWLRRWSTAATSTPGAMPCGRTPGHSFSRVRPTRRSTS